MKKHVVKMLVGNYWDTYTSRLRTHYPYETLLGWGVICPDGFWPIWIQIVRILKWVPVICSDVQVRRPQILRGRREMALLCMWYL